MGLILNIETATNICSVALADNSKLLSLKESAEEKSHSSLLSVYIEEILDANKISVSDLDAIAVSKGPGSYTGLRIGASTAKGLCYGNNVPLISVNTLQVMASGIINSEKIHTAEPYTLKDTLFCPMIDARRMEVYTGIYDSACKIIEDTQAKIIEQSSFDKYLVDKKMFFFGTGSNKCKHLLKNINAIFIDGFSTSAKYMVRMTENLYKKGMFENTAYFEPFYLKDFITTVPKNRLKEI
jgi:tRNA threonylcarbamoyladenosine biosynthesis protein TsaB